MSNNSNNQRERPAGASRGTKLTPKSGGRSGKGQGGFWGALN